ncbi:hypothetical protein JOF53_008400 [Crossiella equi]|uniref:Alkyl sulfatase C-terminal domain-containing protein n=1 Tax=Crossiella equi TaxID=130796 RepID=A0ABS5ASG9_9PSEU|nr:alkyl sulfatase C-terminal domain-containing protein [Crossiella equi]MBP2479528.1 hypothetical protein [Crossiella equi]
MVRALPPWPPTAVRLGRGRAWAIHPPDGGHGPCVAVHGAHGVVLVNSGADPGAGRAVAESVQALVGAPVRGVVYPQLGRAHCLGTAEIVAPEDVAKGAVVVAGPPRWGLDGLTTPAALGRWVRSAQPPPTGAVPVPPNLTVEGEQRIRIGGVLVHLLPVGEDALVVRFPEHGLVFAGEESEPSGPRWACVADRLRTSGATHLLGTHLPLLSGRAKVRTTLTRWRDALCFQHDQVMRRVLGGMPDREAARAPLTELAEYPELRPWLGPAGVLRAQHSAVPPADRPRPAAALAEELRERPAAALMELLRYRVAPDRAGAQDLRLLWHLTDTGERFAVRLRGPLLRVHRGPAAEPPSATVALRTDALADLVAGAADLGDLIVRNAVVVDGRPQDVTSFFGALDDGLTTRP